MSYDEGEGRRRPRPYWSRLLNKKDAAAYCGMSVPTFERVCPVPYVAQFGRLILYDREKLDMWIDNLAREVSNDPILAEYDRSQANGRNSGARERN
jgi:hypothetical protein